MKAEEVSKTILQTYLGMIDAKEHREQGWLDNLADKAAAEIVQLHTDEILARHEQLADMREALMRLCKAASPMVDKEWWHWPSDEAICEWEDATSQVERILSSAPAGRQVVAKWMGQVRDKGGRAGPDIHLDESGETLAIYLPEDCDVFVGQVLEVIFRCAAYCPFTHSLVGDS